MIVRSGPLARNAWADVPSGIYNVEIPLITLREEAGDLRFVNH
jgi:hypothetical protein